MRKKRKRRHKFMKLGIIGSGMIPQEFLLDLNAMDGSV
jgi:hypothetical protein